MPTSGQWINNTICLYNGVLFSHRKERSTDSIGNRGEAWKCYTKQKEAHHKRHLSFPLLCLELGALGECGVSATG